MLLLEDHWKSDDSDCARSQCYKCYEDSRSGRGYCRLSEHPDLPAQCRTDGGICAATFGSCVQKDPVDSFCGYTVILFLLRMLVLCFVSTLRKNVQQYLFRMFFSCDESSWKAKNRGIMDKKLNTVHQPYKPSFGSTLLCPCREGYEWPMDASGEHQCVECQENGHCECIRGIPLANPPPTWRLYKNHPIKLTLLEFSIRKNWKSNYAYMYHKTCTFLLWEMGIFSGMPLMGDGKDICHPDTNSCVECTDLLRKNALPK